MSRRSLGTLTVDLILKMGGFEQGMNRASRETKARMQEIQKSVDEAAKRVRDFIAVGVAAVATGAAITGAMVNSARRSIDEQSKLARSLGTTYDALTALQLRAGDSGIDGLEESLNRMNRRLGAVEMNAGPAVKTVKALRLDLEALANMPVDERIGYIGDRIKELGLSNEETARHLQQLGFEQAAAIELFRDGSTVIGRYRDEVAGLGLSIDDLDAQRVEQMNDALGIFSDIQASMANRLAVTVAPTVLAAAEAIEEAWMDYSENMLQNGQAAEEMFDRMVIGGINTAAAFRSGGIAIKNMVNDLWEGFGNLPPWVQEVGVAGAIIGGKKGAAVLGGISYALKDLDTNVEWFKMWQEGAIDFQALVTTPPNEARKIMEQMGREIGNYEIEGPSILQSVFDGPSDDDTRAWAEQMIQAYEKRMADARGNRVDLGEPLRNMPSLLPPAGPDEPDPESLRLLQTYDSMIESMERQIALFGDQSELSALLYEMEHGNLVALNDEQKERLLLLREQLDALEEQAAESERLGEFAKQFAIQAARNVQSSLAEYLFDPFDEGLKGMIKGLGNTLRQLSAQIASQALLKSLFKGMSNSSVGWLSDLGGTFAGAFDSGGMIPAGQWGVVGEIGPEIVRGPAMVTSREDTARSIGGTQIVINNQAPGVEVTQGRRYFDGGRSVQEITVRQMQSAFASGEMDDAMAAYGLTRRPR